MESLKKVGQGKPASVGQGFRGDIQGLRTLAVLAVVVYHLWPGKLTGGFVGVDVFFVISGFLITGHLWREASTKGKVSLSWFYSRRALRLLPAAMLVLILTGIGTLLVAPVPQWASIFRQLVASALYVENWFLAGDAVDYLAQNDAPRPVQHYWSLSVEEQFYIFWPLLIVLTLWFFGRRVRRNTAARRKVAVVLVLATVMVLSLAYSVYYTAADPKQAYFVTPTRVWEFCVGALCALLWRQSEDLFRIRQLASWAGLFAIGASAVAYSSAVPFPGIAASLPVFGTALVLIGPSPAGPAFVSWWLSLRPMVFVGDISYAVYLWHWPLIVLFPQFIGNPLGFRSKVAILLLTFFLVWLSTHFFEAPIRLNARFRSRRWPAFAIAAGGTAAVIALSLVAGGLVQAQVSAAQAAYDQSRAEPCRGADVLDPTKKCGSVTGRGPIMSATLAAADRSNPDYTRCDQVLDRSEVLECEWKSQSDVTVALVGDSHATQWMGAMVDLAKQNKWNVKTYLKSSCPFSDEIRILPGETAVRQKNCADWLTQVKQRIEADKTISVVFTSAYTQAYNFQPVPGTSAIDGTSIGEKGFQSVWSRLTAAGKKVLVLRDTPGTLNRQIPDCVASNAGDPLNCSTPRASALPSDAMFDVAKKGMIPGVKVLDLSDGFCDATTCYVVLGNLIVYRDSNHMTWQFAESMSSLLYQGYLRAF